MDKKEKRKLKGRKLNLYEALKSQLGVITAACNQVGVSRQTHYKWMHEDENYKQWVDEIEDITLDFAENALLKQIKEGNITANIFYLKTKGKKRGYIEQHDIKTEHSGQIGITEIKVVMANESGVSPNSETESSLQETD